MEWSIYNYLYYSEKAKAYLLYSSLSNMLLELDNDSYQEILEIHNNPDMINLEDEQHKILYDGRFIVQSNETEKNKIILSGLSKRYNSETLSLTIAPTRACNFNCPYCYEKDRANQKMSKQVQDRIIDFVKKHHSLKNLNVIWYGGEPTLVKETIEYLSINFKNTVKNYRAFMVTNGYCLDKFVDGIEELNIDGVQITLDGTKETHDKTRHLVNGKGTFDKIISNIDLLTSKTKTNVTIRMNISVYNEEQYIELYDLLRKRYSNRVRLYPAFVENYNGNYKPESCFDDSLKKSIFLKKIFEERGIYTKDFYPLRIPKGCMNHQLNAFLIGPNGELYKCWHHLGEKDKEIGNIYEPQIYSDFGLLSDLMIKHDALFDNNCQNCVLFPSCNGGCSDLKREGKNVCIAAKSSIEDFIDIHYSTKKIMNKVH